MGPYKYKEWIRDDKFVVDRNPGFYLGQEDGSPVLRAVRNQGLRQLGDHAGCP